MGHSGEEDAAESDEDEDEPGMVEIRFVPIDKSVCECCLLVSIRIVARIVVLEFLY